MQQLRSTMRELGDLGGIVHNLNSDELIGGNQRGQAIDIDTCEIELTHTADEPDEQGTVALGFIVWQGKRFSYRQVRWTEKQCEKANVVANKGGGDWDYDVLANEFDLTELLDWGFEHHELGIKELSPGLDFHYSDLGTDGKHILYITFNDAENADDAERSLSYGKERAPRQEASIRKLDGEKYFRRWTEDLNESD